ncbi:hypothetical protein [Nocardia rhizosphaerihabitans]|uniref:SMODS and SLOG-associating 2TM effector domain-containing protein n=1 Tax=Nocardia rhizosphaerihabitans TaxID=1691570 RepID=A0ABQ2K5K9_9NOCA|nr:hypothetical protein [Nocardia rhizosphaerihabitans]GGN67016.1 hypothetical protein GCM10011610_02650 [Nocardia rhizosphaerihabitans]
MLREFVDKRVVPALDKAAHAQTAAVGRYVDWLERRHPGDAPVETLRRLSRQYLVVVTTSGVVVGLTAAVPGVGTLLGLAATGVDTVVFLEASSVLSVGAAAAYDLDPADPRRAQLVSKVVLGDAGTKLLDETAGHKTGQWLSVVTDHIPGLASMPDSPAKRFLVNYLVKRTLLLFGTLIPAGIGAVIGGVGNNALGQMVVANVYRNLGTGSPEMLAAGTTRGD